MRLLAAADLFDIDADSLAGVQGRLDLAARQLVRSGLVTLTLDEWATLLPAEREALARAGDWIAGRGVPREAIDERAREILHDEVERLSREILGDDVDGSIDIEIGPTTWSGGDGLADTAP